MAVLDLSTMSFRVYSVNDLDGAVGVIPAHGSPTSLINLSTIKYRAKIPKAQNIIGGFPEYEQVELGSATASVTSPAPTIFILSDASNSTATGIPPNVSISVDVSSISSATASSVAPFIMNANPESPASEATASIVSSTPQISIEPSFAYSDASSVAASVSIDITTQATANASSVSSVPTIDVTSPIPDSSASISTPSVVIGETVISVVSEATASIAAIVPAITITTIATSTASIVAPTVSTTGGSTSDQLSFPEDMIDPLWAGNLSGQSYDDTMPVQIATTESSSYSIGETAIGES